MTTLRTIGAIIAGYLLYGLGSMMLVGIILTSTGFIYVAIGLAGLILITVLSAAIIALITEKSKNIAFHIVAILVLLATTANLVFNLGAEPIWYKIATLLLVAPALSSIGITRSRKSAALAQQGNGEVL